MISHVVAITENFAIGKDNKLLFKIKEDLALFKIITTGRTIVMGRKTFDSIGKALPNRKTIVLSNKVANLPGCEVISSLSELNPDEDIFIVGGSSLYEQTINQAQELHLTVIHCNVPDADSYYPKIDFNQWTQHNMIHFKKSNENEHSFTYYHLKLK